MEWAGGVPADEPASARQRRGADGWDFNASAPNATLGVPAPLPACSACNCDVGPIVGSGVVAGLLLLCAVGLAVYASHKRHAAADWTPLVRRIEGIINSMTPAERTKPEIIKASRKRRIAAGAGVTVQEVNRLLNQFEQAQKLMKMMAKGGMAKMMRNLRGLMPGMR